MFFVLCCRVRIIDLCKNYSNASIRQLCLVTSIKFFVNYFSPCCLHYVVGLVFLLCVVTFVDCVHFQDFSIDKKRILRFVMRCLHAGP